MQKKVYEVPSFEVIETECEPMLLNMSFEEDLDKDNEEDENEEPIGSQKKQYGFNRAPWE